MQKIQKIQKAKAIMCFCLVLAANCLSAQSAGNYKLIATPYDTCFGWNSDIMEANNHYYILSNVFHNYSNKKTPTVSVFDKNLNQVQQFPLDGGGIDFGTRYRGCGDIQGFYKNNIFYIFGKAVNEEGMNTLYFAKYNENFELVQPISLYDLNPTQFVYEGETFVDAEWHICDILPVRSNEFIIIFTSVNTPCRLFRLNEQGDLLEDMLLGFYGDAGTLVETDSRYILSLWFSGDYVILFNKDTLSKYEIVKAQPSQSYYPEGSAVTVGNCLIRSFLFSTHYEECPERDGEWMLHNRIIFYNEDLSVKKRIDLGQPCMRGYYGNWSMDYINPDSIYYAYGSTKGNGTSTLNIACFGSEGDLHFNHTFEDITVSGEYEIDKCKAVSDGGVLVTGVVFRADNPYPYHSRGFLFYYHPTRDVDVVETHCNASLRVYPNPANNQLIVEIAGLTRNDAQEVEIYSVVGQKLQSTPFNSPPKEGLGEAKITIDIAHLASGLYFLKIANKTVRFVKQ